jgi:hypothetical protein
VVPEAELSPTLARSSVTSEGLNQAGKKNRLTFQDLVSCLGNVKPRGAVQLGKRLAADRTSAAIPSRTCCF